MLSTLLQNWTGKYKGVGVEIAVEENVSTEKMVRETEDLYSEILKAQN